MEPRQATYSPLQLKLSQGLAFLSVFLLSLQGLICQYFLHLAENCLGFSCFPRSGLKPINQMIDYWPLSGVHTVTGLSSVPEPLVQMQIQEIHVAEALIAG